MTVTLFIALVLVALALTAIFYAAHSPLPLIQKSLLALVAFLVLVFSLWWAGAIFA